jgi:serine/threonine protein kinase
MAEFNGWEKIRELGSGGQSTVFLVRSPQRNLQREQAFKAVGDLISGIPNTTRLIESIGQCLREDSIDELGALKQFDKVRRSGAPPEERIGREMDILRGGHPNLPKFLDGDSGGKWMVTEYFPGGTLDKSPGRFKGDALGAIRSFRPLVETIAHLHNHGIVHRDIKPANVFIGSDGQLVIGDFGIAFDEAATRVTVTQERVGPWDYMPQWGDTGERLGKVKPSFDIYMLGKLLWCMISGRLRMPREYHRRQENDLSKLFPTDRRMHTVNALLDQCIVEHESACLQSTNDLLSAIDDGLSMLDRGLVLDEKGNISLLCLVCGRGRYVEETKGGGRVELTRMTNRHEREQPIFIRSFCCDVCTHRAFFSPGFPDEAKQRHWSTMSTP